MQFRQVLVGFGIFQRVVDLKWRQFLESSMFTYQAEFSGVGGILGGLMSGVQ